MSDPFDLPERELPDHVRQLALLRVMEGIDRTPPRRRTGLAPLLIAASVIALMAGATIVTSTLNTKDNRTLTASPTSPHPTTSVSGQPSGGFPFYGMTLNWGTGSQMERCWSADHKPNDWEPLLQVSRNSLTALLYRVGADLVLCELTKETVTVKALRYPDPPAGNVPAKIMFTTQDGTYAGVVAPGVGTMVLGSKDNNGDAAAVGNGVFIVPNSYKPSDHVFLRDYIHPLYAVPKADLPAVLPPNITAHDPKADRTSPAGQRVGGCLDAMVDHPLPDPDYWQPVTYRQIDATHWVQLAKLDDTLVVCQHGPDQYDITDGRSTSELLVSPDRTTLTGVAVGGGIAYYGFLAQPNAKTVGLDQPGAAAELKGTVENGAFVLFQPVARNLAAGSTFVVRDVSGAVISQIDVR